MCVLLLQVAACAALTNIPYIERIRDALLFERARLFEQLQQVSWLEPYPSQANFILCKVTEVRADHEPHEPRAERETAARVFVWYCLDKNDTVPSRRCEGCAGVLSHAHTTHTSSNPLQAGPRPQSVEACAKGHHVAVF